VLSNSPRLEVNAMLCPSGEKTGYWSSKATCYSAPDVLQGRARVIHYRDCDM
jgi:hypothetical protein